MRYYVTYIVPKKEQKKEKIFRDRLLGSAHWNIIEDVPDDDDNVGAIQVTVSVDERTATFIALKYNSTMRPNYGI